jgi:hypothetical protein
LVPDRDHESNMWKLSRECDVVLEYTALEYQTKEIQLYLKAMKASGKNEHHMVIIRTRNPSTVHLRDLRHERQ